MSKKCLPQLFETQLNQKYHTKNLERIMQRKKT